MVRKSLLIVLLSLIPCVAHAEHERPTFDWRGAWSPVRKDGRFVLAGGSGRNWEVDFDSMRAEAHVSDDVTRGNQATGSTSALTGQFEIAGLQARKTLTDYRSSDGEITWKSAGTLSATVGADAMGGATVDVGNNRSSAVGDVQGGLFAGAKIGCEVQSHAVVCGLSIGSQSAVQGALGAGAYVTSPIGIDVAGAALTLRFAPVNVYPGAGLGETQNVTIDISKILQDGAKSADCFHRHFPRLTLAAESVARIVSGRWDDLLRGVDRRPVVAGLGDNVGRFVETRPLAEPTTAETTPNAGFNHGSSWLAR